MCLLFLSPHFNRHLPGEFGLVSTVNPATCSRSGTIAALQVRLQIDM